MGKFFGIQLKFSSCRQQKSHTLIFTISLSLFPQLFVSFVHFLGEKGKSNVRVVLIEKQQVLEDIGEWDGDKLLLFGMSPMWNLYIILEENALHTYFQPKSIVLSQICGFSKSLSMSQTLNTRLPSTLLLFTWYFWVLYSVTSCWQLNISSKTHVSNSFCLSPLHIFMLSSHAHSLLHGEKGNQHLQLPQILNRRLNISPWI